jgi:hypothetical protein
MFGRHALCAESALQESKKSNELNWPTQATSSRPVYTVVEGRAAWSFMPVIWPHCSRSICNISKYYWSFAHMMQRWGKSQHMFCPKWKGFKCLQWSASGMSMIARGFGNFCTVPVQICISESKPFCRMWQVKARSAATAPQICTQRTL